MPYQARRSEPFLAFIWTQNTFHMGWKQGFKTLTCVLVSSPLDLGLDSLDCNPETVHKTAKLGLQKAKGVQSLQAGRVEASLQLRYGLEDGRKQVKNTPAAVENFWLQKLLSRF